MILADLTRQPPALLLAMHPAAYGIGLLAFAILVSAIAWLVFRLPLELRRIYSRAQKLLHEGQWEAALMTIRAMRETGKLSELWQGRLQNTEGECHLRAADLALKEQRYEEGLVHFRTASELLKSDPAEARTRVIETMLAELRRRFAAWPKETVASTQELIGRILLLDANSSEALFWKGLCQIREEQWDTATATLRTAHEAGGKKYLDPPLYLGILLFRLGQAQEAVRCLAEANRIDSSCPLVTWQLGVAMLAAGGDSALAVRALQRAVGARGLSPWVKRADRMWQEGFPEGRSYVRRLAARYPYECPLLGNDPAAMLLQAQMGLAQAYYRQGSFEEAAGLYGKLLQECPPTSTLLRGLGLSLTRLQRYDQAFKHLRIAFEDENPKNHLTAGYLALCGALGKPTQEADKLKNLSWAIRLLARFQAPGDAEWARLCSSVFTEARTVGMPVAAEDQVRLCVALASVHAIDPAAVAAYDDLAGLSPNDLQPQQAWLYCQAAVCHGFAGKHDLEMFERTVREAASARGYFAERQWDFDAIEYACLERHAARGQGSFPETLGPDYPRRGTTFLLSRSRRLEEAGQTEAATACVALLYALDPRSAVAHDRLAQLAYTRGDLDRAAELLSGWGLLEPENLWPLVRRAIVEQERGQPERRTLAIEGAMQRTRGPVRAAVAYLGARLALREARKQATDSSTEYQRAEELLKVSLQEDPGQVDALACLAALRAARGRFAELAELAPRMSRTDIADARFQLLAAASHLAAGDATTSLESARRVLDDPSLAPQAHYLTGLAHMHRADLNSAAAAFLAVTNLPASSSLDDARTRLGQISFSRGEDEEAIAWWQAIDPDMRRSWRLDRPLQGLVFLAGIQALREGDCQQAALRLVEARQLGCEDARLSELLPIALLKAGQQLLFDETAPTSTKMLLEPSSNGQPHGTAAESDRIRSATSRTIGL